MATATGYRGTGSRIRVTAPSGGYVNKQIIAVRTGATGMIGVVIAALAASAVGDVQIDGEWELPKTTGTAEVFAVGDILYWDVADGKLTKVASANIKAGICTEAAAAAATTAVVKLIPSKA
jgi:predicted RecA/RadA family phage recombinase